MQRQHLLTSLLVVFAIASGASCGGEITGGDTLDSVLDGGESSGTGGGTGGGTSGVVMGGDGGLPCDVAKVLQDKCLNCHGDPLAGGATDRLLTLADLAAPSKITSRQTNAQRSLARMKETADPMPPKGNALATADDIAAFDTWIRNGTKGGTCSIDTSALPTCRSNSKWSYGRYAGDDNMNPGMACKACHAGQNFAGQNPGGRRETGRAYQFMGTVFPSRHEQENCFAQPPGDISIQIFDKDGVMQLQMTPFSPSGNFFYRSKLTNVKLPYTARVVRPGGKMTVMTTPQTDGDCNTCHTEQGLHDAPGRITWPQ